MTARHRRLAYRLVLAVTGVVGLSSLGLLSATAQADPARSMALTTTSLGTGVPAPAASGPSAAATLSRPRARAQKHRTTGSEAVRVYGHGLGPGWGMGQWGAYGYASLPAYRWTYRQIIDHFYGGTHLVAAAASLQAAAVDVDLSEIDGATSTTVAANRRGAHLTVNGAKRWGTRTIAHTGLTINVKASVGDVRVDLSGFWRAYQGSISIQPDGQTWNVVPLEEYVAGVVPIESSAGWGATGGEAALQAQAVAARSYVLSYIQEIGHTCDSFYCQVYEGDPGTNPNIGSFVRYSDEATRTTAGLVVCRTAASACPPADVVATQYAASTGGYTSGVGSPGFPAVVDVGDTVGANPWHDWTIYVSVATVEEAYPSLGALTALKVTERNGFGQMRGRAVVVRIAGTKGSTSVSGDQFAEQFGLYSNWFRFSSQP